MVEPSPNTESPARTGTLSRGIPRLMNTPGAKFVLIGVIAVLLLVPALLVGLIASERADQARTVATEIARGWGGEQVINGPWIAIPQYEMTVERDGSSVRRRSGFAVISAETVSIDTRLKVTERRRSIYSTPLYASTIRLTGRFSGLTDEFRQAGVENAKLDEAVLVVGIADNSGFRNAIKATLDGETVGFEPGLRGIGSPSTFTNVQPYAPNLHVASGVHHQLDSRRLQQGFAFDIVLELNGSRKLAIVPSGQRTEASMKADWPHPGFEGLFLPRERNITGNGFTAAWSVPYLARGIAAITESRVLPGARTAFAVDLVEPLKFYQVVTRALKYSIAFFALVFLAVFIFEILDPRSIHFVQYVLTGLAMVIFYILLLALAERIGFDFAYTIAAVSTTALVSWYAGQSLARKRAVFWLAALIGGAYLIVWLILNEAEYALLTGALVAFGTIGVTMFVTRNVDWQAKSAAEEV